MKISSSREAADEFVQSLHGRTKKSIGDRVLAATHDHNVVGILEKLKGAEFNDGPAIAWALVRAGLVDRQCPNLWAVMSEGIATKHPQRATPDDVVLLLSGITAPGARGGRVPVMPHWSVSLDRICHAVCGHDLAPLRELWDDSQGEMKIGLATFLVRGGALRASEVDVDWAQLFKEHREAGHDLGYRVRSAAGSQQLLCWAAHPEADPTGLVNLWDNEADTFTARRDELLQLFGL